MMAAQDLASKQAGATATGKIDTPALSGLPQVPTNNPMSSLGGGAPAQKAAPQQPVPPKVGEVREGYKYKGGHPGARGSWEKEQ
jgi:hypothetical protein